MTPKRISVNCKRNSFTAAAICLAFSGTALADTLVIRYASGEVQNVALSGPAKDIRDIAVGETSVPLSEKVKQLLLGKQPIADRVPQEEPQSGTGKSKPKLQWAPPLAE
ncbi:hypothetical protein [Geomonas propionica]|uniref:Uncharacterized protein n=1 Tax=Geomonas propionica TaxID=2798582 RepID=A0ABS0YMT2_9BACT|nr:hypothetical protein [Geomonas propionica]MBJ6799195.1 hypothetical protein [Geomonas propionica]